VPVKDDEFVKNLKNLHCIAADADTKEIPSMLL
jgi:hypothetical protein